ncbi:hypothetical protein KKF91_09735 [Myxococcota bacterium]|nr:hypothetical protein [Myxococcota bacterium]MBU1430823.1 hypothetical protein [Myxococcota bacterium]MBU1899651.1 hypothetical protein [Myxococcota bacterium]
MNALSGATPDHTNPLSVKTVQAVCFATNAEIVMRVTIVKAAYDALDSRTHINVRIAIKAASLLSVFAVMTANTL